jgi:hypothetical protein
MAMMKQRPDFTIFSRIDAALCLRTTRSGLGVQVPSRRSPEECLSIPCSLKAMLLMLLSWAYLEIANASTGSA